MSALKDQTKNDSMGSLPPLMFWMIFCITYFFLVGIREIIFKQAAIIFLIGILVCLFLGAFIAAFILKWVEHKWVLVVGGVLVIIGRLVLLYPETASFISSETIGATGGGLIEIYPWYYIGNGCIFLGFNFFVVSLIGLMGKWKQTQKFSAEQMVHLERGIIPAFLFAFGFNLLSRLFQILHSPSVQILLAVISLIVLMQWNHAQPERFEATQGILIKHHWKQEQHAIEPFPPKTKALGRNIILIQWSLLSILLYLPLLHPELLAYQAGIPYHWMQVILFVTIGISAIVVFILMPIMKMNRVIYRKIQYFLCIANTLILVLFGSYLYLPPGQPAAILIYIFTFIIVGVDLGVITQEFWAKHSQVLEISAAIVLFLSNGLSTGLRILLLQAHVPFIWYPILGVIVGINIIQAFKVRAVPITQTAETKLSAEPSHKVPIKKDKAAIALCFLVLLPTLACSYYITTLPRAEYPKDVWASLYTWYGTPSGPAGRYGLPQFDGSQGNWSTGYSTMDSVTTTIVNGNTFYQAITASSSSRLILNNTRSSLMTTAIRTYFEFNLSLGNPSNGDLVMEIYFGDKVYFTTLTNSSTPANAFIIINKVFPIHFTNTTYSGSGNLGEKQQEIRMVQTATAAGTFNLSIASLELSRWKHYNEDYHTFQSEEDPRYWYNDPPVYKATAHNVFYNQSTGPWPEIETYGFYNHTKWDEVDPANATQFGIYDSMDPVVIRSQLRLMEKAGINVVQIMHPWGLDVVELILDIAKAINSNLTYFLYGSSNHTYIAKVMNDFAYNAEYQELYYRINGKPVYNYGYTGYVNEIPVTALQKQVDELKRMYPNIFLVGDGFSGPFLFKEELLDILDGWYYYDTSAFYRHGWGDPEIENYQADGSLPIIKPHNQLDRIFGMQAALARSKGKSYCAIIIPGTDNTCVHDFIGSPLYDGRTGTINERKNGLTFDRTWEAAIKAGADQVCIVSWNELHEGTEIEPTIEDGAFYVERCAYWSRIFQQR